ncbi:MAG: hypothetical protein ACFFD4_33630 [Candidatus Odinarchaeota archaeon]
MAQFVANDRNVLVNGRTIMSIVDGMGLFSSLVEYFFHRAGLPRPCEIVADENHWYPQQKWLDAFRLISEKVGAKTLFLIGKKIPENAAFPPDINNIEAALESINIAYHMNHKNYREGGIGSYGYEKTPGKNEAIMVCDNPYPCDFDLGIITAMAKRFSRWAIVTHDDSQPCRKHGAESCTYTVTWKH